MAPMLAAAAHLECAQTEATSPETVAWHQTAITLASDAPSTIPATHVPRILADANIQQRWHRKGPWMIFSEELDDA